MTTDKRVKQAIRFREEEVGRLMWLTNSAESATIIGISGVGKSNLFHHLLDPATQQHYLGDKANNYIFVRVNFHYAPDFTSRTTYSLIIEQFELLDEHTARYNLPSDAITRISQYHDRLLAAGDDLLMVQRQFKLAVHEILRHSERKLIFLFDQFDHLYRSADPRLFANLRGLREAYKYRLCYFVFTRNSLLAMGELDRARDEFYELLAANVIGLKTYSPTDSLHMLLRVAKRNQLTLKKEYLPILLMLTGGHAGLLRATYLAMVKDQVSITTHYSRRENFERLLAHDNVEAECEKIWTGLTLEEQELLADLVANRPIKTNTLAFTHLQLKGILTADATPTLFAILFSLYIDKLRNIRERIIKIDPITRTISIAGKRTRLKAFQFHVFKLLYEHTGQIVSHDDIIRVGTPQISAENFALRMSNLIHLIEPNPQNPQYIEKVGSMGYRLQD
ncbi:MAG TPA: hypothetical protein ENJ56_00465 [Anaerolineae bacterium]|nr:hypothetical protein [Anaerolineae bacterium]